MTLATEGARLLAEKRRTHGGPTGLTTENEAGAYAAEQFAMWLCLNGERLVDALVEAERDAEIGRMVRRKLTSHNEIPVERAIVWPEEIATIDAAKGKR